MQLGMETAVRSVGAPPGVPSVDLDPYNDEVLARPYDFADVWLNAGPIFWLSRAATYCVARHTEIVAVMKDWQHFGSAGGVGLIDKVTHPGPMAPSLLLEADPPQHTASRSVMNKIFSAGALKPLIDRWKDEADALVKDLVDRRTFDAIADLGNVYGHKIVPREIGLTDYRPDLLHVLGTAGNNSQCPINDRGRQAQGDRRLPEAMTWLQESCQRERLSAEGWGSLVHAAADRGECSQADAQTLTRSLIAAGVENTIIAVGNMIHAFAIHPEQWAKLRADPGLARNAVDEVMRWDGPTIQFYRTTSEETRFGDIVIPTRTKVMLQIAAASRDPGRWPDPHRFDIERSTTGHLGFGFGMHQCLGQIVARQQMSAILEAFVRYAARIELAAPPVRRLNNQAHAFEQLQIAVTPA
jgi:4-methoxybenzoate monooxygenase (O-demethylating)